MIIEKMSYFFAQRIFNRTDGSVSIEVLKYSITYILNFVFTLAICIGSGLLFDRISETLMCFLAVVVLRRYTGGYHFKSIDLCTVVSAAAISIIPFISFGGPETVVSLTAISLVICIIFGKSKWYVSGSIVALNFVILSNVIAYAFLLQAITLIKLSGGGEKS